MNFADSEDQEQLRDGLRRFIADRYDFDMRTRRLATINGTDRSMWERFAEMGWLAVLVPESAGGLGWSFADGLIVAQEFGRGLVAEPFVEAGILATRLLVLSDISVSAPLLEQVADGTALVAPALLEPHAGYDLTCVKTRAVYNGSAHVLNGRKVMIAGGDAADHFIVSAEGPDGLTLFAVPGDLPGIARHAYRGLDGSWLCDLRLDDVHVGPDAVLAGGNHAQAVMARAGDEAVLAVAAETLGCMERVLELTAAYLETRKQFGQPLSAFQVLQHRMADLFVETEMARSALYGAIALIERPGDERSATVSAARARIDQAAHLVGNQGVHLHGGMGMTIEYPVGHYYRRLLVLARRFGDADYHLDRYERLRITA